MNASTVISAVMGSAGTRRAPSAVFVTRVTERPPLETIVKVRIALDCRIIKCENQDQGNLDINLASVLDPILLTSQLRTLGPCKIFSPWSHKLCQEVHRIKVFLTLLRAVMPAK